MEFKIGDRINVIPEVINILDAFHKELLQNNKKIIIDSICDVDGINLSYINEDGDNIKLDLWLAEEHIRLDLHYYREQILKELLDEY